MYIIILYSVVLRVKRETEEDNGKRKQTWRQRKQRDRKKEKKIDREENKR